MWFSHVLTIKIVGSAASEVNSLRSPYNGRELLYQNGDQMMAVFYTAKGDSFVPDSLRCGWKGRRVRRQRAISRPTASASPSSRG
jgi:hypothetical protein